MNTIMHCKQRFWLGWLLALSIVLTQPATAASIADLLDKDAPFVALPGADFAQLGADFVLPDAGRQVSELANKAQGGAFDPRDLESLDIPQLGYKPEWVVERFNRYELDWDITGLKLSSLSPDAGEYPWVVIINGGAANVYEFFVDLKNKPGWAQYLAQKLNVMIVTIPGNFKYGGWKEKIDSPKRQPAYLLDKKLSMEEYEIRNSIMTNSVILQGLKQLLMKNTSGELFIVGHSTSGELAFLAKDDPELGPRLNNRFLGWGSGGPARVRATQAIRYPESYRPINVQDERKALHELSRRDPKGYGRTYSRWMNPLYEAGMSTTEIAAAWLEKESRRRANFKQQIQSLEHSDNIALFGWIETSIRRQLADTGNPWGIEVDPIIKDLFSTYHASLSGYQRMVWTVARFDRNHWVPEEPAKAREVWIAEDFRAANPKSEIKVILWDIGMTHYGHLEKPQQLADATYQVIRWLTR